MVDSSLQFRPMWSYFPFGIKKEPNVLTSKVILTLCFGWNVDSDNDDDEIAKTLAILIGLIAGIALIIVFVSALSKACEKDSKGNQIKFIICFSFIYFLLVLQKSQV